jgi:hypothetical protein
MQVPVHISDLPQSRHRYRYYVWINTYRSEIINNEVHWAEGLYVAKFISVTKFVLKYLISKVC